MLAPCDVVHSLLSWVVPPVASVFIGRLFLLDYKTSVHVSSEYVGLFYGNLQSENALHLASQKNIKKHSKLLILIIPKHSAAITWILVTTRMNGAR